jgi:hypothetical protein
MKLLNNSYLIVYMVRNINIKVNRILSIIKFEYIQFDNKLSSRADKKIIT